MKLIELNIDQIRELCRKHKVKQLFVFGSILTDRFNDESDVDLLVDFNSEIDYHNYADNYFDLYHAFESVFGRAIDLVDVTTVKNRYFKEELDETKLLIYGQENSKSLTDILSAINEIESFMAERHKEFNTFCTDTLFRRGVERNIEIMGEAMNRTLKEWPDIPITASRKIVDTRHYVIHSYDTLRPDILWSIVINHLPLLKSEVETLLKEE